MIADSISMRLSGGEGVHQCENETLVFKVKNVLRSCEKRGIRKWRRTRLKRTIPGKSREGHRPSITNLFFFLFLFSIVTVADGQRMFTAGDSEFSLWQFEMFEHIFLSIFTLTIWNFWTYFPQNFHFENWNVWTYFPFKSNSNSYCTCTNVKCLNIFPATLEEQLFSGSKEATSTPSLRPMVRSFRYFWKYLLR